MGQGPLWQPSKGSKCSRKELTQRGGREDGIAPGPASTESMVKATKGQCPAPGGPDLALDREDADSVASISAFSSTWKMFAITPLQQNQCPRLTFPKAGSKTVLLVGNHQ